MKKYIKPDLEFKPLSDLICLTISTEILLSEVEESDPFAPIFGN